VRRLLALLLAALAVLAVPAPASAAPSPGPSAEVKYYVVRDQFGGEPEFLFEIAQRFLGSGDRNDEIFQLNKGRLQPDGLRLTKPEAILPGWILQLPADAEGEGVRTGPLPAVTLPAPTPAAALTPAPAPAGLSWWEWASLASGAVLLLAGGAMAAWWAARRRRPAPASRAPSPGWPDTDRYYRLEDAG